MQCSGSGEGCTWKGNEESKQKHEEDCIYFKYLKGKEKTLQMEQTVAALKRERETIENQLMKLIEQLTTENFELKKVCSSSKR